MKFLKALVVCLVISLPLIYGFNICKNKSWELALGVTNLGQMPAEIKESSGLETGPEPGTFFTHNDRSRSGNPEIFKIDKTGKLLKTYVIKGAPNEDWEDLAQDNQGNLYIADIGNNNGNRNILHIYKVKAANPDVAEGLSFSYGQDPKGKKHKDESFNAEALFWSKGKLYVVTKSQGKAETHLFEMPDKPGHHIARLVASRNMDDKITGADISPDGSKLALLSLGKLYLFSVNDSDFFGHKPKTINLGNVGQTEGLVFTDNRTIVFSNESGYIYKYNF